VKRYIVVIIMMKKGDSSLKSSLLFNFDLNELSKRKGSKWERYGLEVIPMWVADTDYGVAPELKHAMIRAIQEENLHYSNDRELLDMMAAKVNRINGIPVETEGVYVTQGVIPVMWLACKYACERSEEVVVTDPMYFPFFTAAATTGARKVLWPLREEEGYGFDVEELKNAITPKTRLIFLCNPHNPTGRVMTKQELSSIADLAVDHDLIVVSDELWEDIVYDAHRHISIAALGSEISDRTLTVFGFSKAYSISGLQVGYAATTNKKMMKKMKKIAHGVFRGTTTISMIAAKVILSGEVDYYVTEELRYLHRAREYSLERMKGIEGIKCNALEGTYLLFPNISAFGKTSEEMVKYLLEDAKVGVSDGSRFGSRGEGHIRLNIGTSLAVLEEGLNRIESSLGKL
jgi:bifunctional pyridoxal-dependent enzyme with beta-cystathionase and maltose regulon repressor activities